ncbi:hypothetical protein HDE_09509 [Halotydeus destructor]|nr:hypothetical protein HDE_09509 [Halotydeus destructor]
MDLFAVPPTQVSIASSSEKEYRPINQLRYPGPIEFEIKTGPNEYINLSESFLKLSLRIKLVSQTDKKACEPSVYAKVLRPSQYLLHSLFKSVELSVNNKSLSRSPQNYAYKAYFEALLGYGTSAKKTFLTPAGWCTDEEDVEKLMNPKPKEKEKGKTIDLMGTLHLDLAMQDRAILGGTPLCLKLIPNSKEFIFMHETTALGAFDLELEFLSCSMLVAVHDVTSHLLEAHNKALRMAPAKYPVSRMELHESVISANTMDAIVDNIITGQLPRRLFVTFVKNTAYNGDPKKYPFHFEHLNVNFMALFINGVQYPAIPYQPDFKEEKYQTEYLALFRSLSQNSSNPKLKLTYAEYGTNHTIFPFMLAPDLTSGCGSSHVSPIKYGSIRLQAKFATQLKESINVLCFAEYDNIIEIDEMRNVYTSY